jgi:hypothetical protein
MNNHHTRFIICCITLLSMMAVGAGTYLLVSGYQSGELLAQMASSGLSGLVGFLGGKMAADKPGVHNPDAVITTELKNSESAS